MRAQPLSPKIHPEHLARQALIYIRQSTLAQVRDNTGSQARQYDLVQRAGDLGWPADQVVVIDQDQGRSGASANHREGFQWLVAQVGLGQAGAVLSVEASRLARACSDWYRLLEICSLTDTLVIDEEGIYDPSAYNDRLLLGFKGTMSEAELHWLRQRLLGGKREKAQQGQLRFRLPTGFVYDPTGQVCLDPDEQVQQAIRLVFELFTSLGSALAVVQHFTTHQLPFPTRFWGGTHDGELVWRSLCSARVLAILHNPAYAGAYVYGRTHTRAQTLPGEAPRIKGRTRQVKAADWPIILQDHHPAYLTWDQFLYNQQRLADNRTWGPEDRRGAVRQGTALLQGIVRCGRCGRPMSVRYVEDGTIPYYSCAQIHTQRAGATCQSLRGDGIDAAVARTFLEAMQPAQLEVSLAALDQVEDQARKIDRQWQLRIERAQYEADLARRRFMAVDPDNRLVARTLERDWNEKLADHQRLERDATTRPRPMARLIPLQERQRILALAQDLSTVWHATTTTHAERKQLLRFLLKDVTLTKREMTVHLGLRWQTEARTEIEIPRPRLACECTRTAPAVIEQIRLLAPTHTDHQIAHLLNQGPWTPGQGGTFTASKVQWLRFAHHLATACPQAPGRCPTGQRGDGRYSARATAELLNVDVSTIATWCQAGQLDCLQEKPHGPRWINLPPETIAQLRKPTPQRWSRTCPPDPTEV